MNNYRYRVPSDHAKAMLVGAYDIHVHANPSYGPNHKGFAIDGCELVEQARNAGLKGVCIKNHETTTVFQDYYINKGEREKGHDVCVCYSSLTLNLPNGGFNPFAVDYAVRHGARCIWAPTYSSQYTADTVGWGTFEYPQNDWRPWASLLHPSNGRGLSVYNDDGKIRDDVLECIAIARDANVMIATGHMSPKDSYGLCKVAISMGHRRVALTHPNNIRTLVNKELMDSLARMGVFLELTAFSHFRDYKEERCYGYVREIGTGHFYLTSDSGQPNVPKPVDALAIICEDYLDHGFDKEEVEVMMKDNPETLILP